MNRLVADGVTLTRGGRVLAERLRFAVAAGGALLLAGPNGAGKTSLLRLLAGLARADDALEVPPRRALLGERDALDGERRLADALAFWAWLDGRGDAAVGEALATVGLAHLSDVPVRLLSTGQRRRAAFARVVASEAALWLLDEPASGVDAGSVPLLEAAVARHRAAGGIAVVATHQAFALPQAQVLELGAGMAA